jgi:serine/threonine protein kinase
MSKYFGSWIVELRTLVDGQQHLREVRWILFEYVIGTPMMDVGPQDLTQEARENIMRKVIKAHTDLRFAGLEHGDFEPRNIMICPSLQCNPSCVELSESAYITNPGLQVCVISFAISYMYTLAAQQPPGTQYRYPLFTSTGADICCQ